MSLWSQDFCLKNGPSHEMAVLFPSIGIEFLSSWRGMSEYKGQFLASSNFIALPKGIPAPWS